MPDVPKFWRVACTAALGAGVALHAAAQQSSQDPLRNPFEPPSFGEIMGDQVRELGSHLDARNRLAQERAQNIRSLTAQLAACGQCAKRAELQASLDYWKSADQMVNQAENAALSTMGLGQYRNLDELKVGLLDQLVVASHQVEQQRQRTRDLGQISMMVRHECEKKFALQDKPGCPRRPTGGVLRDFNQKVQACVGENDPLRLYGNDQMIRELCGKLPEPRQCIADNSIVVKAQAYNQASSTAEMNARREQRRKEQEDFQRRTEIQLAEREQAKQDRELRKTLSREQYSELQRQRREEFYAKVTERTRKRRECEDG